MIEDLVEASIDYIDYDYVINGEPLHGLLFDGAKAGGPDDFGVNGTSYLASAIICQPNTTERLLSKNKPDLIHGLTALYVCGHCGDYDGTLVGVHVNIYEHHVIWSNIGLSSDVIEFYPKHKPFEQIPSYSFKSKDYYKFIEKARYYEVA